MAINGIEDVTACPMRSLSSVLPMATKRSAFKFASILQIVVVPSEDPTILGYILHGSADAAKDINRTEVKVGRRSFEIEIYV